MKIRCAGRRRDGAMVTEAVVALALLATAMLPIAFAFQQETRTVRSLYFKAAAMEVVDGGFFCAAICRAPQLHLNFD